MPATALHQAQLRVRSSERPRERLPHQAARSAGDEKVCAESPFSLAEGHPMECHQTHASRLCPRTLWLPSKKSDPEVTVTAPLVQAIVGGCEPLTHLPALRPCGRPGSREAPSTPATQQPQEASGLEAGGWG